MGAFEYELGFTLRERKSRTLDQLQVHSLEVEANFTSIGKSRGNNEPTMKKKGKEETSSSGQYKELRDLKWEEMDKLIRSLSHKVVKLELENKSLPKQNAQGKNQGYNP